MSRNPSSFFNATFDFLFRSLTQFQTERHVVKHGHVRIKRVVLEHHRDVSVFGCDIVDQFISDEKFAFGNFLKTRDHAQGCGLTATGRANENKELFILYFKRKVRNRGDAAGIFL